jgi:hypothetical protein
LHFFYKLDYKHQTEAMSLCKQPYGQIARDWPRIISTVNVRPHDLGEKLKVWVPSGICSCLQIFFIKTNWPCSISKTDNQGASLDSEGMFIPPADLPMFMEVKTFNLIKTSWPCVMGKAEVGLNTITWVKNLIQN